MLEKLWIRLLLAFAAVLGVAVGTVAIVASQATTSQFQDYVSEGAARLNQRVERIAERLYREQGWPGVVPYVYRVAETSNLQVVVVDQRGLVVADTDGRLGDSPLPRNARIRSAPSLPLLDAEGAQVGTIYLRPQDQARSEAFLAEMVRGLILGAALGVLVALALSFLLARRIVTPVERLTAATQRMELGDLSPRIENTGSGELARLSHAFNAMAEGLERGQRLRRNMVADIAHELRTPLHNVLGYLEMVRDGVAPPTPEVIASIHEEAAMLSRLVADLHQLALAESGQLKLERRPISISGLLHQAATMAQRELTEKNVEVVVTAEPDLPEVSADEGRIRQVLRNLLGNAIAVAPPGSRVTLAATFLNGPRKAVEMAVTDTGPGIAPDDLPYIFERFYRADRSRARATGGAGLGLTIARQLVEAHGGTIRAESGPGQGASFRFTLPVSYAPEPKSEILLS